jgi:DNA-binding CsgD family transcriptional regulator
MAGDVVDAVLAAAGHRVPGRREGPDGLTRREVEVLRLLARGLSAKRIAQELVISPKTARNHIEHVYTKIGATSRVIASLYAVQHGLLPDAEAGTELVQFSPVKELAFVETAIAKAIAGETLTGPEVTSRRGAR